MKLIDKSALVADIERRIKETESMEPKFDQFWAGQISAFKGVLKILDTLEVKKVDLKKAEQFIKDYTKGCSNELCAVEDKYGKKVISYREWLTPDQARKVVEIAKEETIEKAWDWIDDNMLSSNQRDKSHLYFEQFRNYMKGE